MKTSDFFFAISGDHVDPESEAREQKYMSMKAVKATISDPCNIFLHLFAWSQVKLCHGGKSTVRDGGTKKNNGGWSKTAG